MYKKIMVGLLIITLFLLMTACGETTQEPKEEMKTGLLTSTYTYQDENMTMKISVNNIDKSGTVDIQNYVSDAQEGYYSMDEGTYNTDQAAAELESGGYLGYFTVFLCNIYWGVFRDFDNEANFSNDLQEENPETITIKDEQTNEEKKMSEFLKGFKATKFSVKIVDKEDKSTIVECHNIGTKQDDLQYVAYNTTTSEEEKAGEEAMWAGVAEDSDTYVESETTEEERTEYASCIDLGCDEKHVAIGDKSTNEWYYCDCPGASNIPNGDRTCFSSTKVAEAVGYYKAGDCE